MARLFDHLVRDGEQVRRHRDAEHLGCSNIDDHFDLGGLAGGWLLALQYPACIAADLPVMSVRFGPLGLQ
jgi:hypothetical protein